jgi:hypothetical protein
VWRWWWLCVWEGEGHAGPRRAAHRWPPPARAASAGPAATL